MLLNSFYTGFKIEGAGIETAKAA
jgi:hypothetical protein